MEEQHKYNEEELASWLQSVKGGDREAIWNDIRAALDEDEDRPVGVLTTTATGRGRIWWLLLPTLLGGYLYVRSAGTPHSLTTAQVRSADQRPLSSSTIEESSAAASHTASSDHLVSALENATSSSIPPSKTTNRSEIKAHPNENVKSAAAHNLTHQESVDEPTLTKTSADKHNAIRSIRDGDLASSSSLQPISTDISSNKAKVKIETPAIADMENAVESKKSDASFTHTSSSEEALQTRTDRLSKVSDEMKDAAQPISGLTMEHVKYAQVDLLARPMLDLLDITTDLDPLATLSDAPVIELQEDTKQTSQRWMVSLDGGALMQSWSITGDPNGDEELTDLRNASEKALHGFGAGADLRYQLDGGIFVGLGAHYRSYRSLVEYTSVEEDQVLIRDQLLAVIFSATTGLAIDSIIGDTMVNRTTTTNIVNYNSYRQIQIPISLGYLHEFKNRWIVGVQGTANLGFWMARKGAVLNAENSIIDFDEAPATLNEDQFIMSYTLSAIIGRKVTDRMSLYIRPYFEGTSANWLNRDLHMRLRPNIFGANIGIGYHF